MTQPPVDPTGQPDSSWDDDLPDPVEPAEDDLCGWWPGDDCGPPVDVDAWLAKLSPPSGKPSSKADSRSSAPLTESLGYPRQSAETRPARRAA